jgi:hypothetical protein
MGSRAGAFGAAVIMVSNTTLSCRSAALHVSVRESMPVAVASQPIRSIKICKNLCSLPAVSNDWLLSVCRATGRKPHRAAKLTKRGHQDNVRVRIGCLLILPDALRWRAFRILRPSGKLYIVSTFCDLNTTKPPTKPNATWQSTNQPQSTRAASAGLIRSNIG